MTNSITDATQVTPEWLTNALREGGSPGWGKPASVRVLRSYITFTSQIHHLSVAYTDESPDGCPGRLFLKVPRADVSPEITSSFRREVHFYRRLTPTVLRSLPTIPCYSAAYCPETGLEHLLLEDVSDTHEGSEWPLPPEDRQCEAAVVYLARLHACLWESPLLFEPSVWGGAEEPTDVARVVERGEAFLDFLTDRLDVKDRGRFAAGLARLPAQWERFVSPAARTFIFGDAHFGNFLYPRAGTHGPLLACDWQHWQIGSPAFDLSYMIALNWHPERRQSREAPLLRLYHRTLLDCGVNIPWRELLREYRLFLYRHLLVVPAWQWSAGVPSAVWWSHVERGLAAWRDLGCDEFLQES